MHELAGPTCSLRMPADLHLDLEGVQGVDRSLAGCTSHCSGHNIIEGLVTVGRRLLWCRGAAGAYIC